MGIFSKIGEMQAKGQKAIDDYNEKEAIRKEKNAAREDRLDAKIAALPLGLGTLVGPVGAAAKFEKGERKDAKKRAKKLKTGEVQFKFAVDDGQVFDVKPHGKSLLGPLAGAQATVETEDDTRRRITATRIATIGVFALAAKKKTGGRDIHLVVEGDGFCITREVTFGFMEDAAREFAATFNEVAAEAM